MKSNKEDTSVMAQADGESGVLCRNWKRESLMIWTGIWSWEWINCCMPGTDMDGCDFSMEDSACAQWAVRPQKPSDC